MERANKHLCRSRLDISSKARSLNFGLSLHIHPLFVYVSKECPGKLAHMYRLTWPDARRCEKCRILVHWPTGLMNPIELSIEMLSYIFFLCEKYCGCYGNWNMQILDPRINLQVFVFELGPWKLTWDRIISCHINIVFPIAVCWVPEFQNRVWYPLWKNLCIPWNSKIQQIK